MSTRKSSRRTRSVPAKTRRRRIVSSKNSVNPYKFTRILVGNSPENNSSPIVFKPKPKSRSWFTRKISPYKNTNIMVPNSIHPEDVEGYQLTQFTNYKSRQMMKDHLNEYIKHNPHSTYEQWIRDLFPENTKINKYGHIVIDARFYLPQAESLKYWKNIQKNKKKISRWEFV